MYIYPVKVQFEDIDAYNIAHHTKIICYLERARVNYFADNGVDLHSIQYGLVLRNISISFKKALLMLEQIDVIVHTKDISKYKFKFAYELMVDGNKRASAEIEMAVIDLISKRPVPIPEEILLLLKKIEKSNEV